MITRYTYSVICKKAFQKKIQGKYKFYKKVELHFGLKLTEFKSHNIISFMPKKSSFI